MSIMRALSSILIILVLLVLMVAALILSVSSDLHQSLGSFLQPIQSIAPPILY
jgi:cell shape-determining protein MreC